MQIDIVKDYDILSKKAAQIISAQIIQKPNSVLGLATGSTPIGTYRELVRMCKEGIISFADVVTFNLDEYYGLDEDDPQSYHYFMREYLFKEIDIKDANAHILDGKAADVEAECRRYENCIKEAGGIDLQLLGIGQNGHIGFNEPGENFEALTHLVNLHPDTIRANARFFNSIDEVPTQAITMGIKTIMRAKKIVLLANGESKAEAIYQTLKGKITPRVPASVLQLHPDITVIIDEAAAVKL
ncbi:glucosamine-6-phosphate deaminase [Desulfofalx alkaliphila]|uniref:glucosamine-6-phosphate deaminase n=1 Tax=Desulfofalx alkaliphila TaxID=105483 RepID=UPI0004E0FBB1|nr:glucosamine-6-phosphate deaminase [Desulfofalx alkaliphila]